jgi:hypothetical protein
MAELAQPAPPRGILAGQIGIILSGEVLMGDIAVTAVDLALRHHINAEQAPDGTWLIARSANGNSDALTGYERTLLHTLPSTSTPLAGIETSVVEKTRKALVHDAVANGWLSRFSHGVGAGGMVDELADEVRAFGSQLGELRGEQRQQAMTSALLPYALHFELFDDMPPLGRFGRAWAASFATAAPGRRPPRWIRSAGGLDPDVANAAAIMFAAQL